MAGNLFVLPRQIPLDIGVVLPNATLTFTQTGTTTPQNTYQDVALTTAHANPVVADANGVFAAIYFDPSFSDYRVRLEDSTGSLIYQVDGVPASQSGQSLTLTDAAPFIDLIESDGSANNTTWRLGVNGEQLTVQLVNDALSSFTDILTIDRTANTVDVIDFLPTTLNHNGIALSATNGSFTPVFAGFSADPTGDVRWIKRGNMVMVRVEFFAGTSNATTFHITNWPTTIQPDDIITVPVVGLVDNGASPSWGVLTLAPDGSAPINSAEFHYQGVLDNWTASGSKGLSNAGSSFFAFSYPLAFT